MFDDCGVWIQGHNLMGYLPNSGPSIHETWQGAKDSLLWDLGDNGLADYYAQGLDDHWISMVNGQGCDITLAVMEYIRDHYPDDYDHMQHDNVNNLQDTEEVIAELKGMTQEEPFWANIEHSAYWIDYAPSLKELLKDADIDPDEFDSVDEALDALNEAAMV